MLWLVLAAQLASTHSSKPKLRSLVGPGDVPVALITPNKLETVGVAVTVGPDGKIRSCNVKASSGNSKLDSYTCNLLARRAKFAPAPTYLVERTHLDWWVGNGYPPKSTYADLYVTVAGLPAGLHSPVTVDLDFNVDQAGNISGCRASDEHQPAIVVPTACAQLTKRFKPRPVRADDGNLVSSRQDATVVFETN